MIWPTLFLSYKHLILENGTKACVTYIRTHLLSQWKRIFIFGFVNVDYVVRSDRFGWSSGHVAASYPVHSTEQIQGEPRLTSHLIILRILVANRRIIQVILYMVIVLYLSTIKKIWIIDAAILKNSIWSQRDVQKKFKHQIQFLLSHIITTLQYKKNKQTRKKQIFHHIVRASWFDLSNEKQYLQKCSWCVNDVQMTLNRFSLGWVGG